MKKTFRFILTAAWLSVITSCASMFDAFQPAEAGNIQGVVTDTEGNPINHIKITLQWEGDDNQLSVYSSSKGEFIADLEWDGKGQPKSLNVTLEDIDGEDNGGFFESLRDKVMLLEENGQEWSEVITLDYRMTLATALESNRQSW
ncbi:MAG: hypothetical protein E7115_00435 [Bacteroidales bacterium]|nr:hypothetical protein [Bacteroidales bacterium]